MPKRSVRAEMLARRENLASEDCFERSLRAQKRLLASPGYASAAVLALYSPIRNEVFTEELFAAACRDGKRVAYPRVRQRTLEFVEVRSRQELGGGAFGILEPQGEQVLPPRALDLIVVPGVAFDGAGHRLGYGQGFYDRVLHSWSVPGLLAGLCYEFQMVAKLPNETHDVRMNFVVTEEGIREFDHIDYPRRTGALNNSNQQGRAGN